MKMQRLFSSVVCAILFGIVHGDVVTNIYTVTTETGSDYKNPFLLDEMTVTCTDTAGSVPVQKSFATLAAEGFGENSILRKCGAGYMQSSIKLATFKGEIHVEEGGFIVNTNLMTGAQNYEDAPIVRVSSGATFMLRTLASTCPNNKLTLYNEFHLAGEGFEEMGVICNASENSQYANPYSGPWYLEDDVKIYHASYARWDMGDSTGANRAFIDMKGHDLAFVRNPDSSVATWCLSTGVRIRNPGNVYVDGQRLWLQVIGGLDGDSENCLVITNDASLGMYDVSAKIPWTVKFYGNTSLGCNNKPSGLENTNRNAIAGPVEIHGGTLRITGESGKVRGTTFHDTLSGEGNISVDNCWLQLMNGGKTLTGQITVDGTIASTDYSGLALWSPESVPMACAKISFTNTQMRLMASFDSEWDFPQLDFHVASGTNNLPENVIGGTIAGLKKSGSGMLVVPSPFSVTGITEVAEGTLKIGKYGNAGLYCGRFLTDVTPLSYPPLGDNIAYWDLVHGYLVEFTNRVDLSLNAFNSGADSFWKSPAGDTTSKYVAITYAGYIWNRSGTTQRWTFAGAGGMHTTVRIDDRELYWFTTYNEGNKATVDVGPGPHKVYFSTADGIGKGGPKGSAFANMTWTINGSSAGVMYDPEGKNSDNAADYVYMLDPGDGSLFTQSTNETVAINNIPLFSALKFGENAVLDTFGNALVVDTLVGIGGVITNSNPYATSPLVSVTNAWRFSTADVASGRSLHVNVPISFSAGAKIGIDFDGRLRDGEYTIFEADDPIVGRPLIENSEYSRYLSLRKSPDGRSLVLVCRKGFQVVFR